MARKRTQQREITSIIVMQKLAAGVALLMFGVVFASSLRADAPLEDIVNSVLLRGCLAMLGVKLAFSVVVKILKTYEEMNSGQT